MRDLLFPVVDYFSNKCTIHGGVYIDAKFRIVISFLFGKHMYHRKNKRIKASCMLEGISIASPWFLFTILGSQIKVVTTLVNCEARQLSIPTRLHQVR